MLGQDPGVECEDGGCVTDVYKFDFEFWGVEWDGAGFGGGGGGGVEVLLERGEGFLGTGFVPAGEDDGKGERGFVDQALYNRVPYSSINDKTERKEGPIRILF